MTDPFEALREPVTPVNPDPDFAGRLRMRLTREVFALPGGSMSQPTVATRVEREPAWPPALTPYIVVSDAAYSPFPELEGFIEQRYALLRAQGDWRLYRFHGAAGRLAPEAAIRWAPAVAPPSQLLVSSL